MAGKTYLEVGSQHRKLTIVELVKETPFACHYKCKCECGKEVVLTAGQINCRIGSCGCRSKPFKTSAEYRGLRSVWKGMMRRCYNPKHLSYYRYGGRGIKVCDRWHIFSHFFSDLHATYIKGLELDRKNNDGHYEMNNVRWVTSADNLRNTSNTKMNWEKVDEIRKSNETCVFLAKKFGVYHSTISNIKNYKTWIK